MSNESLISNIDIRLAELKVEENERTQRIQRIQAEINQLNQTIQTEVAQLNQLNGRILELEKLKKEILEEPVIEPDKKI